MQSGDFVTNPTMVLVYDRMNTGGIETMMLRMVDWLVAHCVPVVVCCLPGGELQASISAQAHVINYETSSELLQKMRLWCQSSNTKQLLLMSFDSAPAARALMLEANLSDIASVANVTGVFHPKAYFMPGQPSDRRWLNKKILGAYGSDHVFFMNRESLQLHAAFMSQSLDNSPVIPIPVEVNAKRWEQKTSDALRAVSVGRLVDFKAYNLGAPQAVRHCIENGVNVLWDIYGYGPQFDAIQKAIVDEGVQDRVFLKGLLEYKDLYKVITEYDVFVGMGTAAVEAAALGMPTLVAQVESLDSSHGYFDQLPFGNIGEVIEGQAPRLLSQMLSEHGSWSAHERQQCGQRCFVAASQYSVDDFMKAVLHMGEQPTSWRLRLRKRWVTSLAHALLDGWIAKYLLGRGLMSKLKRLRGSSLT
jgi:Glycosyl transferases group 1